MTKWSLVTVPEQDLGQVRNLIVRNQTARGEQPWPNPSDISDENLVRDAVRRAVPSTALGRRKRSPDSRKGVH